MPKKEPTSLTASVNSAAENASPIAESLIGDGSQRAAVMGVVRESGHTAAKASVTVSSAKDTLKNAPLIALMAVRRVRDELRLLIAYVCFLMGSAFKHVDQCLQDHCPSLVTSGVKVVRGISKAPIRPDVERVLLMSRSGSNTRQSLGGGAKLNAAFPLPVELGCERLF